MSVVKLTTTVNVASPLSSERSYASTPSGASSRWRSPSLQRGDERRNASRSRYRCVIEVGSAVIASTDRSPADGGNGSHGSRPCHPCGACNGPRDRPAASVASTGVDDPIGRHDRVLQPELFALIEERRAAQRQQQHRSGAGSRPRTRSECDGVGCRGSTAPTSATHHEGRALAARVRCACATCSRPTARTAAGS